MRPVYITQTGAGSSKAVPLARKPPYSVAVVVTGTVNYTIQYTYDDVTVGITTWWNNPSYTGLTINADAQFSSPITAVRVTVNSGTGSATMQVLDASSGLK